MPVVKSQREKKQLNQQRKKKNQGYRLNQARQSWNCRFMIQMEKKFLL